MSVRSGGRLLPVRRAGAGRRVLPHTAASLWSVAMPERTAGTLAITYRGFLLPRASTLPYPPFALGRVYDTMEAGNGRFFLNGLGTWLPLVVDRAGRPISGIRGGALRLALSGATLHAKTITNMGVLPTAPGWGGKIGPSALMAAPYAVTALAFAEDLSAVEPSGESLSAAQLYAAAWRSLEAILPGQERTLEIAYSPVAASPELVGNILVASDLHPYRLPRDPVTGSVTATPAPEGCLGELVSLWWSEQIHRTVGLFPRPATPAQSEARHVLAALDFLHLLPEGERPRVTGDLRRGGGKDCRSDRNPGISSRRVHRTAAGSRSAIVAQFWRVMMQRFLTLARYEARITFSLTLVLVPVALLLVALTHGVLESAALWRRHFIEDCESFILIAIALITTPLLLVDSEAGMVELSATLPRRTILQVRCLTLWTACWAILLAGLEAMNLVWGPALFWRGILAALGPSLSSSPPSRSGRRPCRDASRSATWRPSPFRSPI